MLEQLAKAWLPMLVTVLGRVTLVRLEQLLNALSPIVVRPLESSTYPR